MKIVVLDGFTVNPGDISWEPLQHLGDCVIYDRTPPEEIIPRTSKADFLIVNKVRIREEHFDSLPSLKAVFLLATGYDNVDVEAAKRKGIPVFNARNYGTESVAQHTMALILGFQNRVEAHHWSVQRGDWAAQDDFSYNLQTIYELKGKTLGIVGYGQIGRRVGELAGVFGMNILALPGKTSGPGYPFVSQKKLFEESHFISLHAPLNDVTREIINAGTLEIMRNDAVIINTGRGGLINEGDLANAIVLKKIRGAALDVLSIEPPHPTNRLCQLPNVLVTPHCAWRSFEARRALLDIVAQNIRSYLNQSKVNRVV